MQKSRQYTSIGVRVTTLWPGTGEGHRFACTVRHVLSCFVMYGREVPPCSRSLARGTSRTRERKNRLAYALVVSPAVGKTVVIA